jgi:hypothetical protein
LSSAMNVCFVVETSSGDDGNVILVRQTLHRIEVNVIVIGLIELNRRFQREGQI